MRVILAQPRGFCAGVVRAVDIVERALATFGPPVYVRHEIVHNAHVVADLKARGAVFVREVDEIPEGAVAVFSAHGVARKVERAAAERGLDSDWPPVLVAFVVLVVSAMAVSAVVVFRALRREGRAGDRRAGGRGGRKR